MENEMNFWYNSINVDLDIDKKLTTQEDKSDKYVLYSCHPLYKSYTKTNDPGLLNPLQNIKYIIVWTKTWKIRLGQQ